jgi:hypothetical protein
MPTPDHDSLPDVAVGRHPDYGIVASNPQQLAASTWMLNGLSFHPVPGHSTLYALADQQRNGQDRATRAVALLRMAGYRVDADAAFDPSPASERDRPPCLEPDVAFAEHPQLGIIAATADTMGAVEHGGAILESHGWRFNFDLDVYALPVLTDRNRALGKVAAATLSMHRSDLQVAVQPRLARDVAALRRPAPPTAADLERSEGFTNPRPRFIVAALAASPARAGRPGKAPVADPAISAAAERPADPRIAFSRNR